MSEQFDVILGGLDTEVDVTIADSTGVDPSVLLALRGEKGDTGAAGQDGTDGVDGADGFSPIATVSKVGDTATISITDLNGTTTANISDGTDGQDGRDGVDGQDGYTPIKGVDYFDGQDGQDGADGQDGFSPIATVTKSGDTATISITDANGTTTATVTDGADGQDGSIVSINRKTSSGTNIADITIDGVTTELYAPNGGGGTITDVEVDGTSVVTGGVAEIDLTGKSDVGHTHTKSAITDFPTTVSSFTNDAGYITGVTSTDTPTADTIAEFDASAHINSTDMTSQEVDDFVGGVGGGTGAFADKVVEQGTSGIWTYRKWNSGIAECWCRQTVTVNFSNQIYLSLYTTGYTNAMSYPDIFTSINNIVCSGTNVGHASWATLVSGQVSTSDKTVVTIYMGWNTGGNQSIDMSISLKGRWQ